jgi:hypothetical protein
MSNSRWDAFLEARKDYEQRKASAPTKPLRVSAPTPIVQDKEPDRWDYLKDYPGQHLEEREFRARLDAHAEARARSQLARDLSFLGKEFAGEARTRSARKTNLSEARRLKRGSTKRLR